MEKTIFEKIIDGEIPSKKIYEDDDFFAFLDIKPKTKGHTLVITKKPYKDLLEIPEKELEEYLKVVQKIAKGIKESLGADGFHLFMNNGESAWQEVFHAHIHIVPRFEGEEIDANPGTHIEYKEGEMEEIQNKITAAL
jgi:histidine triad (HIT) family protein